METLIIGKPAMNVYLPLQEFPAEGDIFNIRGKNESLGNVAVTTACLMSKWGIPVHFQGVTGNDAFGETVRNVLGEFKVDTKYLEQDFTKSTAANYIILNVKSGVGTKVLFNDPEMGVKKHRYDFKPDWAILDGTDMIGAHGLLNNDATVKTIFYARIGDKDTIAMSKRCTYVVCTQTFAEQLTKTTTDFTAESLVAFYQRIVDAVGSSNYIVVLNNHKILYSEDGKVKMLPEMKINEADKSSFDSIFTGGFAFGMVAGLNINDAIKLGNTAAAISLCRIGEVAAIPELDEVLSNSGLKEKLDAAIKGETVQATAQDGTAPAPMNPNVGEVTLETPAAPTTQEVNSIQQVVAGGTGEMAIPQEVSAQPTVEAPQNAFAQVPVQDVQQVVEPVQAQPVMETRPVTPAPVEMPQVVQQPVDPGVTTNV